MKFRYKISAVFSITLLLSFGAVAFIPQAKASPDEVQATSETEATTAELPAEAETPAAETSTEETSTEVETQEPKFMPNPRLVELGLDTPSFLDSNGSILIPEHGTLLDICLPESLGEDTINIIAPGAFSGTSCLRSITLPSSIMEIGVRQGEGEYTVFADCPNLEYIVLQDRFNLEGLTLGENWNGNATVIFGLVQETSSTESTEETVEPSDPKQELPYASSFELADIDTTSSEDIDGMISGENAETNS